MNPQLFTAFLAITAVLLLAPGPIVHRSPTTEAWIEAFSETVVCDPMSVLFPILHVLQGWDGTGWIERNG